MQLHWERENLKLVADLTWMLPQAPLPFIFFFFF